MRKFIRLFAFLTLISSIMLVLVIVIIWGNVSTGNFEGLSKLNWGFIMPSMFITCGIIGIGASGVMTMATNPEVWRSIADHQIVSDKLQKERDEVLEIRDKLTRILLKQEDKLNQKS